LQKFDKCFGATGRNYGKVTGAQTHSRSKGSGLSKDSGAAPRGGTP